MKFNGIFLLGALLAGLMPAGARAQGTSVAALGYNLGPTPDGLTNVIGVGVLGYSVVALRGDGSLTIWWNGASDPGVSNLVSLCGGWSHVLGFTPQGTISGHGDDSFGEISGFPPGLTNAAGLASGYQVSFAILPDGSLLGVGDPSNPVLQVPPGATNVVALATVDQNAIALRADGTVIDWHDGTTNEHPEFSNVVAVATDGFDDAVLFYDGTVTEWPNNDVPDGFTNLVALAGGNSDFLVLQNNGVPLGWGRDEHGEVDIPPEVTNVTAFAVAGADGYTHTIFLMGGTNAPPPVLGIQRSGGHGARPVERSGATSVCAGGIERPDVADELELQAERAAGRADAGV